MFKLVFGYDSLTHILFSYPLSGVLCSVLIDWNNSYTDNAKTLIVISSV